MDAQLVALPMVLPVIAFFALWWLLGVLSALGIDPCLRVVRPLIPHQRSLLLLGFALYSIVLAAVITLIVFAPPLSALVVDHHCHGDACGVHVPIVKVSISAAHVISLLVLLPLLAALGVIGVAIWRSARLGSVLALLATSSNGKSYRVLDSDRIMACCVGLLRPTILLSRALLDRASAAQIDVVVQHERAHRFRFDNLRNLLAGIATLPWPANGRARLLAELQLAAEQSCDYAVSRAAGGAGGVVETIEALDAWQRQANPRAAGALLNRLSVDARIVALLRPQWHAWHSVQAMGLITALLMIQVVLMVDALHHVTEAVLQWV